MPAPGTLLLLLTCAAVPADPSAATTAGERAGLPAPLAALTPEPPGDDLLVADRRPVSQEPATGGGELVTVELPAGPGGTGTDKPELLHYQLPADYSTAGPPHPLLVAYHGFGTSAAGVAAQTTLDELCFARGFVYLAPTGIDDQLFGSPVSQQNTEAAIRFVLDSFHVDRDRVCLVGFSMGGGVVASFAARHRDPDGVVVAALGLVSATCDWTMAYRTGGPALKAILENPYNFGGPPGQQAFAYQRASTLHFHPPSYALQLPGQLVPELSMVANLGPVAVYQTWDTGDPMPQVTAVNPVLAERLALAGAQLVVRTVSGTTDPGSGAPAPHSWAVLDEEELLDFFADKRAVRTPRLLATLADRDGAVAFLDVQQRQAGAFSAAGAEADGVARTLALRDLRNVQALGVDLPGAGLDPAAGFTASASSLDAEGCLLRVQGALPAPAYLVDARGALVPGAEVDPFAGEVRLPVPPRDCLHATTVFEPDWTATLATAPDPLPLGVAATLTLGSTGTATRAYLVVGQREALVPLPGGSVLAVSPLAPAAVLPLELGVGDGLALALPPVGDPALAGQRLLLQAVLVDARGTITACSNRWALHIGG